MNDIVTRLRVPLPWMLKGMTTKQLSDERREAVDEIERLRTHCDEWASIAEELMKWSNSPAVDWQHEMYKKSINRYFKAVHDGL